MEVAEEDMELQEETVIFHVYLFPFLSKFCLFFFLKVCCRSTLLCYKVVGVVVIVGVVVVVV